MSARVLLLLATVLCTGACTTLSSDRHARELADNRQDDEYCVAHALHFPDPGYVQCRRQLVDRRLYRDWQNVRLMQQAGQPQVQPPAVSPAPFRKPDPAAFHCHAEPQFGNDYVFCGYDESADGHG